MHAFLFFKKKILQKIFKEHTPSECQTVWIQIMQDILSVTGGEGYHDEQTIEVVSMGKRNIIVDADLMTLLHSEQPPNAILMHLSL